MLDRTLKIPRTLSWFTALMLLAWSLVLLACKPPVDTSRTRAPEQRAPASELFACDGRPFAVDLNGPLDTLPVADIGEQSDQIRDWLWAIALEHHGNGGKLGRLDELALPMRPPAWSADDRPPGGLTREAMLDTGELVLMLPTADELTMRDALTLAYDRVTVGTSFEGTVVRYRHGELGRDGHVWMCRLPDMSGASLLTEESGMRLASVSGKDDLDTFLTQGVELQAATCSDGVLHLRGRQRAPVQSAPMTANDVATLVDAHVEGRMLMDAVSVAGFDPEIAEIMRNRFESIGFSLDPVVDNYMISQHLISFAEVLLDDAAARALASIPEISAVVRQAALKSSAERLEIAAQFMVFAAMVSDSDARQLKVIHDRLMQEAASNQDLEFELIAQVLFDATAESTSQCARYDGLLAGTAVGMSLFYTDLLAKLALQGHLELPRAISSEPSIHHLGEVCESEQKYSGRLWFEPRASEFVRKDEILYFGPDFTQLLAKRQAFGSLDEIAPATAQQQFINRWNAAWPTLMAWEPQYARLNEIQKWTALVRVDEMAPCLEKLQGARQESYTLDTWIAATPGLQWGAVEQVGFSTNPIECLPLIDSRPFVRCGDMVYARGGVSLAGRDFVPQPVFPQSSKPTSIVDAVMHGSATAAEAAVVSRGRTLSVRTSSPPTQYTSELAGAIANLDGDFAPDQLAFILDQASTSDLTDSSLVREISTALMGLERRAFSEGKNQDLVSTTRQDWLLREDQLNRQSPPSMVESSFGSVSSPGVTPRPSTTKPSPNYSNDEPETHRSSERDFADAVWTGREETSVRVPRHVVPKGECEEDDDDCERTVEQ